MVASTKINRSHTPKRPVASANLHKKPAKPNASILSFFQKAEKIEGSLFVDPLPEPQAAEDDLYNCDDNDDDGRFNESESSNKKRRTSIDHHVSSGTKSSFARPADTDAIPETQSQQKKIKPRIKTPFVMDSDSDDDSDGSDEGSRDVKPSPTNISNRPVEAAKPSLQNIKSLDSGLIKVDCDMHKQEDAEPRQGEVQDAACDEMEDFTALDDLDIDDFEGEEMRERRFMREQARLEAEESGTFSIEDFADDGFTDNSVVDNCPICNESLVGVSTDDATRHVNSCLDGDPIPLIHHEKSSSKEAPLEVTVTESSEISKRFARAAVPRPGQANPFEFGDKNKEPRSAFSKLMSNNAEDSAWSTAAAAENASRGRPSYERTCPFYKIMPGFAICVDAFRYGAVAGCNAYFLSHFHSDHYIGLTANWRHGPIYCSKATGSLVKQQLRTASKWVVEIEFEKKYDIPGTDGATVTMIPANHCPGSSMFIFEKAPSAGPNGRVKRILHCGDFRACPAHVKHPLLKPDILNSSSAKLEQQKIDICYLDTTYLNPRYSFPPQDDVIRACADLCASMSPDPHCKDDVWTNSAKEVGTPAVSKYFQSNKPDDSATLSDPNKQSKQRLLVICGTYSIGKERICVAIAKALRSKIFATAAKRKICEQLQDAELSSLLTSNAVEAQVHMQSLMEIRAETLQEYLDSYRPHFSRIVGFRPSGWNYRPPNGKAVGANTSPSSIPTPQILHGKAWRPSFGYKDFVPIRGSTKEAMCFGVPYSEHSSFRELAMFIMSLRIEKVIPTVNVGSDQSRKRMKAWLDRWMSERRRCGLVSPLITGQDDEESENIELWDGKPGKGASAWW